MKVDKLPAAVDLVSRNRSIDLVKIVAMFGVICLHSTSDYLGRESFYVADIMYRSAVVSVPLFFMVSGFLLLGRKRTDLHYSIGKILGILRYVAVTVFIYWVAMSLKHIISGNFSLDILLPLKYFVVSFFQGGPFAVYWYFGAMIIIYALLPVLNRCFVSKRAFLTLFAGLFLVQYIAFVQNLTNGGGVLYASEPYVNQCFRLWNWLFYFCLGGFIKRYEPAGTRLVVIVVLGVVNLLFQMNYVSVIGVISCEFFYSSAVVVLLSACVFVWLTGCKVKRSGLVDGLSRLFLPVYSVHYFIAVMFSDCFGRTGVFAPICSFVAVSVLSVGISYIVMKIPYADKLLRI